MKDTMNEVAKTVFPAYNLAAFVAKKVMDSSIVSEQILKIGSRKEIENELFRKTAEAKIFELEAKVSQEVAIAKRIENAIDVEIEEYYESGSAGNLGGSLSEESISFELSGDSKKITKRIYKFKGRRDDE